MVAASVLVALGGAGGPTATRGAYPGANGRIVFQRGAPYDGSLSSL